ncbi:MAG: flavodoxin family protein [candidate division NC10 bacterium]|nr:flavodoxin family protein [candidate division NC10 bacterium]
MRVLGICGTHKRKGKSASEWMLNQALAAAQEVGAATEAIRLIHYRIQPCLACNCCLCGRSCPLLSDPEDEARLVFEKMYQADAFIFSSPVYAYQTPAIVVNLLHRTRPFHELERAKSWGNRIQAVKENPFAGAPVGNMAVGAAIGLEGALYGLLHPLMAMGATSVACTGIALIDSEMRNLVSMGGEIAIEHPGFRKVAEEADQNYEENECAIEMARAVGKWVVKTYQSAAFQRIKHHIRL